MNNITLANSCGGPSPFGTIYEILGGGTVASVVLVDAPGSRGIEPLGDAYRDCQLIAVVWNGVAFSPPTAITGPIFGPARAGSSIALAVGISVGVVCLIGLLVILFIHVRNRPRDKADESSHLLLGDKRTFRASRSDDD